MSLSKHLRLVLPLTALTASVCVPAPSGDTQQITSVDQVPEGLSKSDWTSIRTECEARRHTFQRIEGGWHASNPGQQWTTKFDGRGFLSEPKGGGWKWGLELMGYGFPGATRPITGVAAVTPEGPRLTYAWDSVLQEWWVNDLRGLEHGFTLQKRPGEGSDPGGLLQFGLMVRGSLQAKIAADGLSVQFRDTAGNTVLRYSGLKVWDADGKTLASHFDSIDPRNPALVTLSVDEREARYPLTIDPIAQQAYLKASNTAAYDYFGYSVTVSGDTVAVGKYGEDSNAGAVYVFVRSAGIWKQQARLKASNPSTFTFFGISVSLSGDTLIVGAHREYGGAVGVNGDPNAGFAPDSGAAYVFVRNGTNWSEQAYLKASNTGGGDYFGHSVGISGDTAVVGAYGEDSNSTGINGDQKNNLAIDSGAAYVFVRSGTNWSQQAYLKASNTGGGSSSTFPGDEFGYSVAVSGGTIVIGAPNEDSNAVGIDGNQSDNSAYDSGAAYVFVRSGTNWSQQAYLKASNTGGPLPEGEPTGDQFGWSVAVSSDTVVVGSYEEDSGATGVNGNEGDNYNLRGSGAAYVFVRSGTVWSQEAYLKASNTGYGDNFGAAVAVWGDLVLVGAVGESSATAGLNGDQGNNSAYAAGAAYVFERSGVIWTQTAYLKASNTGEQDLFGCSVAVSGDTLVVGAYGEDGNSNNAESSGAAYVFNVNVTTAPEIVVEHPPENELTNNVSIVDLGGTLIGARSGSVFTIRNTGNAPLTNVGITITGANSNNFTLMSPPASSVPGNNGSTTFTVAFTPDGLGDKSATLHIFSNDSDESPFDIRIKGTSVAPIQIAQQAYLKASNTGTKDWFGLSVAVSGDTVVVGARFEDSNAIGVNANQNDNSAPDAGAAYVFVRSGTNWVQQAYLKASNAEAGDLFGESVSVSGDTVVVGARSEASNATGVNGDQGNNSAPGSGAAYVFVRSETNWSQQAYLKASNTDANDNFGHGVWVSGDVIVVGAYLESSGATGVNGNQSDNSANGAGAAYVFVRNGTTWSQQAYLKASNADPGDVFGDPVAVSGDTIVVGAVLESSSSTGVNGNQSDNGAPEAGAAYVFVRNGTTWSQQAYLKASNTGATNRFGSSVSVSGDTVVVGAPWENSSSTGVNGNQNDSSASKSGASYVFVRGGTTWSQQAYLKASNADRDDRFGESVSISGDTMVVGAFQESSDGIGVNGNQTNNNAFLSGAAYVFARSGTNWIQHAYLKASNTDVADFFGFSVAVSSGTLVIGAREEDSNAAGVNGNQNDNGRIGSGAAYVFAVEGGNAISFLPEGNGYYLRFNGIPNLSYRLQRAHDVTGPWSDIATNTAPASGLVEYHETNPLAGQAFYRTVMP
jgi:hypothetical protein